MTMTMTPAMTANKPCHCGCGGHSECCELECLIYPRFFCGQLLADQDLTALVEWIKNKTGLARFRHGWGIVCGLDVRCGAAGSVTVTPGYALDCCGRDVVICEEATFDLGQCWKKPLSPCSSQPAPQPAPGNTTPQGNLTLGGFSVPRAEVQVFDVLVRYSESLSDSRNALARGGCGGAAGCEYTRVHESYELYCSPANDCDDPSSVEAQAWLRDYKAELDKKLSELAQISGGTDVNAKLQRFAAYLERYPPSTFCFLRDWICDLQKDISKVPEGWDSDLIFWIFLDWRNGRAQAACPGCGPQTGIRLARVWVWKHKVGGKDVFTTLYVSARAPFRRALAHDAWPASSGSVNLAPYLGDFMDVAALSLQKQGIVIDPREFPSGTDLFTLAKQEVLMVQAASGGRLAAYHYPDPCNHRRIVYFKFEPSDAGFHPRPARIEDIPADHPRLNLTNVPGIGDATAARLKAKNIHNLVDLAKARPDEVKAALADMKVAPPNEMQLINSAQQELDAVMKGA
jgi:hypothetical protein